MPNPSVPGPSEPAATPLKAGAVVGESMSRGPSEVVARVADFADLSGPKSSAPAASSLDHLLDVNVRVTAELGRITLSINDVLKLGIGSVVELSRPVAEPVDLMVQGTRFGRGEVVVVDDRFAIRITEIHEAKRAKS